MKTYQLQNLASQEVVCAELPKGGSALDRPASKALYSKKITAPETQDCFVSLFSGMNPAARVNADNPPAFLHGIAADYDTPVTGEQRQKLLGKMPFKPSLVSTSFSGGTHAYWEFEKPIPLMGDPKYTRDLLSCAARELGLANAFGALDRNAYYSPSQYYHIGWDLQDGGGDPIREELLWLWVEEASAKANWSTAGEEVPLERVAEEVGKRFPGRWKGEFVLGARGVRFWDLEADNSTAAVVKPTGMLCWTGPVPFMKWSDIFGPAFCTERRAEGEGRAIKEGYFISNSFWFKSPMGEDGKRVECWTCYNRNNAESLLADRYGLATNGGKRGEQSQVKRVIGAIINHKSLCGVLPCLYNPDTTVEYDGRYYLNISTAKAMQYAETDHAPAWGEGFPWIAGFLENLLDDEQRDYFLSWLSRAYKGAVDHAPLRGQAIYIAGRSGAGKNLLSERIIGPLLGGRQEAVDYLTGATKFNRELFASGVWCIDDATPLADAKAHRHYSAMLKRMVANSTFMFEAKFVDAVKVPWMGRLVVTCNDDPESLRILPQVDINNTDKLMFFHTSAEPLADKDPEPKIARELPAFAAYLYHYEIPEHCRGGSRFGVKGYLHPELFAEAEDAGPSGIFRQIMDSFLAHFFEAGSDVEELRGSALDFYERMVLDDAIKPAMEGLVTSANIGMRLGQLACREGYPVKRQRTHKEGRGWVATRKDFMEYMEQSSQA